MVFLRSLLVIIQHTTYQMRVGGREPREGAFEVVSSLFLEAFKESYMMAGWGLQKGACLGCGFLG